jgi:L-ornithine Nalpha-acyltransferase
MCQLLSTNGGYSVRLASSGEKRQILRLRYKVFTEELKEGSRNAYKQDSDAFDRYCDFLVLVHKSDEIVGLYRVLPYFKRNVVPGYYSETEFRLRLPEQVAELGRLCIKKEHRGKGLLNLLWLGLLKYAEKYDIRYFFGCGSLRPETTKKEMQMIYSYIVKKCCKEISRKYYAVPHPPVEVKKNLLFVNKNLLPSDINSRRRSIGCRHLLKVPKQKFNELCPTLIKKYLRVGVKIVGTPAYDPLFGCYDFLLLMDLKKKRMKLANYLLKLNIKAQMLNKRIINKICQFLERKGVG